jgi:hypothetical protein
MAEGHLGRRDVIGGAALLALVVGVPAAVVRLSRPAGPETSERQMAMIREVAQLTLPKTVTPGAGDIGVGDFVALALAHGLDGTRAPASGAALPVTPRRHTRDDGTLDYLGWLEGDLDGRAKGDFLAAAPSRRQAALAALDAEAFVRGAEPSPWAKIKGLILTGYYTSETGGSKELRYELVPGRWDPDLPYESGTPAWSSDWTAVEFS